MSFCSGADGLSRPPHSHEDQIFDLPLLSGQGPCLSTRGLMLPSAIYRCKHPCFPFDHDTNSTRSTRSQQGLQRRRAASETGKQHAIRRIVYISYNLAGSFCRASSNTAYLFGIQEDGTMIRTERDQCKAHREKTCSLGEGCNRRRVRRSDQSYLS